MTLWAKLALSFAVVILGGALGTFLVLHHAKATESDSVPHVHDGAHPLSKTPAVEVEIIIRDGRYQVLKGEQPYASGVSLVAGADTVLILRNGDTTPHEFISPLFIRTDIHFAGRATGIFRKEAAGFRLNPGDILTLRFTAPFSDFRTMYDLIWCSQHGEQRPEGKELLILVTKETQPRS